jgi:mono/diheme cytochrome c family protein
MRWKSALVLALLSAGKSALPAEEPVNGQLAYETHCLTCHQADGRGVPRMQPPLVGSAWIAGDAKVLAAFVITGGFNGTTGRGGAYGNVMPPFRHLDDETLAAVLSYVRDAFGDGDAAVTAEDVKAARESTPGRE